MRGPKLGGRLYGDVRLFGRNGNLLAYIHAHSLIVYWHTYLYDQYNKSASIIAALGLNRLLLVELTVSEVEGVAVLQQEETEGVEDQDGGGVVEGVPGGDLGDQPDSTRPQQED